MFIDDKSSPLFLTSVAEVCLHICGYIRNVIVTLGSDGLLYCGHIGEDDPALHPPINQHAGVTLVKVSYCYS